MPRSQSNPLMGHALNASTIQATVDQNSPGVFTANNGLLAHYASPFPEPFPLRLFPTHSAIRPLNHQLILDFSRTNINECAARQRRPPRSATLGRHRGRSTAGHSPASRRGPRLFSGRILGTNSLLGAWAFLPIDARALHSFIISPLN